MHLRLRVAAGDVDLAVPVDVHVHLAPRAELRQVNPRLDREARPRQHAPLLVRLQVVHVGAVAVRLLADGVAGAVTEEFSVARLLDNLPRRLIDLPALKRLTLAKRLLDSFDARIASAGVLPSISCIWYAGTFTKM